MSSLWQARFHIILSKPLILQQKNWNPGWLSSGRTKKSVAEPRGDCSLSGPQPAPWLRIFLLPTSPNSSPTLLLAASQPHWLYCCASHTPNPFLPQSHGSCSLCPEGPSFRFPHVGASSLRFRSTVVFSAQTTALPNLSYYPDLLSL